MQAPLIDKRSYADLVAETGQLAGQLSGWQPRSGGQPDAGQALIGVFARFAELVIERLNRAPDKNYLAFLNLIGALPIPPQAARVPLTFHLATGSPVDALVPAGTLAAAPPQDEEQEDVVFETDDQTSQSMFSMPKVKKLIADEGVTFDNSFVSLSVCCPSRAAFLTGQ